MWFAIVSTIVIAYLIYYFCFKPYNYWKNRGIIYEIPLPLIGNFGSTLIRRKHVSEINDYLYKKYSNERYVGVYIFMKPALLIRDVDLVKRICVDEFEHFCDRVQLFSKDADIGPVLTNLTGPEWRRTRNFLNPIFRCAQIKGIFDLTSGFAENYVRHLVGENETLVEIQLYEVFSKFENEVICLTCFGSKYDNQLKVHQQLKRFSVAERIKLLFMQLVPCISELFEMHVYPTSKTEFFKTSALETIHKREMENTDSHNFIHYLMEARKGSSQRNNDKGDSNISSEQRDEIETVQPEDEGNKWTDEELATQALMFLNSHGGLEPLITASSFMAYELAFNPDIQVKLQEEIDNVVQNSRGITVTYHALLEMEYMDCVISECMRKWPPVYQIDRRCVKNYFEVDLPIPDDEKIVIEKGTTVIIPIMAIHRDPAYFSDPHRFNPERFNSENRDDIVPGTYIPFGWGPRNCIGSQFALLKMKLFFFHLLLKFDLVPTENTMNNLDAHPFKFDKPSAVCTVLGLKHRKVTNL